MRILSTFETVRKYVSFIAKYKRYIIILSVIGFFSSAFRIALPYLSKNLIDTSFMDRNAAAFIKISIISAVFFLVSLAFKGIESIVKNIVQVKIKSKIASAFLQKILTLDMFFFQGASTGENIYRLEDTERVSLFLSEQVPRFFSDILMFFCMVGLSFYISPVLTLPLILLFPFAACGYLFTHRKRRQLFEEVWKNQVGLYKTMGEIFSHIFIIKAFRIGPQVKHRYIKELLSSLRLKIRSIRLLLVISLTSDIVFKGFLGGISVFGGWMIIKGRLTLGQFTAFLLYSGQLVFLASSLGAFFSQLIKDSFATNKFLEIMQAEPSGKKPGELPMARFSDKIEFSRIAFGYRPDKIIFKDLSFKMQFGHWHALVGPSGCGKTTLISLLLGLYQTKSGTIYIDGKELSKITPDSLAGNIAIASQQPFLFSGSIEDNIACLSKRYNKQDIFEAARLAGIHEFIVNLPKGYGTVIGENALCLSEGEKQKIAIARALIRRPSVLVLDEAMASLDSDSEYHIVKNIKKMDIPLVILVSHRLSTVMNCEFAHYLKSYNTIISSRADYLLGNDRDFRILFNQQTE